MKHGSAFETSSNKNPYSVVSDTNSQSGLRVLCIVDAVEETLVKVRLSKTLLRWAKNYGGEINIRSFRSIQDWEVVAADVVIFQRLPTEMALAFASQVSSNGTFVGFEVDDLLYDLPSFLKHHDIYLKKINKNFAILAGTADFVSVSTPRLATHFKKLTDTVFVVPNYAEPMAKSAKQVASHPNQTRLLVSSTDDILIDFLIAPLLRIQEETGVHVVAIGSIGRRLSDAGVRVDQLPLMKNKAYKNFLSSADNCIGLAPLDDSEFSSCKSAIKFFDYAVSGIPIICSNVPPYSDAIHNNLDGLLVENTTEQWLDAMRKLISSHELRQKMVEAAQHTVRTRYSLDAAAEAWQTAFCSLNLTEAQRAKNTALVFRLPRLLGIPRRNWSRLRSLCRHLLRPASYGKAMGMILKHRNR